MNTSKSKGSPDGFERSGFAKASPWKRGELTAAWLTREDLFSEDIDFVRTVRERDLADARSLFAPNLTMVGILLALFAISLNLGMGLWVILAPVGMLVALFGAGYALHRITTTSQQLALIDSRTG